jgi:alkylhydroperoxidase family enzyme
VGVLEPPYDPAVAAQLAKMMPPNVAPIALFRTVVRNLPMAEAMTLWGSYELSRSLSLSLRDREIVIDRTCVRCGCEYEWGVHIAFFAEKIGFTSEQVAAIATGPSDAICWTPEEQALIALVDNLVDRRAIAPATWTQLAAHFDEAQILEAIALVGYYHTISFLCVGLELPLESYAARFPGCEMSSNRAAS